MDPSKWPARAVLPVAVPGLKYIFATILFTGMLFYFGWTAPAWAFLGITCFVCWFFRDPDRKGPDGEKDFLAPADGRVIVVDRMEESEYLDVPCQKVSIFMNVFNVHVNRIPFDGVVQGVKYNPGKFINASFDKASIHNERNALIITTEKDKTFAVVQIAGLIARRIVNCVKEGERITRGERYGMIQFGSRLDLYLPTDFEVRVKPGDKTQAGVTLIGYMN
ncbi:phosphatidylserine decarboxylase family protein [Desulfospira joergensenii]|uniref:phosphatidylserine decarboxylase family protein n=1 Tax=Desulfospira joergensenii TaxID=53329 RepID=UPI0003B3CE8E|nr:phosphatidylserine decarboxylase family protein [Desulfospira joergensenii]